PRQPAEAGGAGAGARDAPHESGAAEGPRRRRPGVGRAVRPGPRRRELCRGGARMTARRDLAYTTRRFSFAAAHRYHVEGWSAEENRRAFGELGGVHGHNYTLDVTIRGPIDPETGMVIDLGELKRIIGETVVER